MLVIQFNVNKEKEKEYVQNVFFRSLTSTFSSPPSKSPLFAFNLFVLFHILIEPAIVSYHHDCQH